MKKLLLIPCVIFPYVLLFNIICIFTGFLMEELFQNFILVMILYLFIYVIFVFICNMSYIIICRVKKISAKEMAKANMIIKLVQIPGYVAVFILGFICLLSIFTIGFTFFFFLYDCIAIFLTGIIGSFAIFQNKKSNEKLSLFYIVSMITQFVFCIDVVSSILLYLRIGINGNVLNTQKKETVALCKVSKIGVITYLGAFFLGLMLAISEVIFPEDSSFFLKINPWYDTFFYMSLGLCIIGFIASIIKKNKLTSSQKEYFIQITISLISFIAIITGVVFSKNVLGRFIFSFGFGVFIVNIFGFIQTFIGLHKNPYNKSIYK